MIETAVSNGHKTARRRKAAVVARDPLDPPPVESDAYVAMQKQLAEQLVTLRAEFQEAVACYSVRIQSMLAQVGDLIAEDVANPSPGERKARARVLRRAVDDLSDLDLKPAKGRRRDLKSVENFATELGKEIAEW